MWQCFSGVSFCFCLIKKKKYYTEEVWIHFFIIRLIGKNQWINCLSHKPLISTYCVTGAVLGTEHASVNKTDMVPTLSIDILIVKHHEQLWSKEGKTGIHIHGNFHFNLDQWVGKSLSLATCQGKPEAVRAAAWHSHQDYRLWVKLSGVNPGFSLSSCVLLGQILDLLWTCKTGDMLIPTSWGCCNDELSQ